jgi:hypothetical protein
LRLCRGCDRSGCTKPLPFLCSFKLRYGLKEMAAANLRCGPSEKYRLLMKYSCPAPRLKA